MKRPRGRPRKTVEPTVRTPEELRLWREGRGLTQPELAKLLDIHTQTVWRYEHGDIPIARTVEYALRYLDKH